MDNRERRQARRAEWLAITKAMMFLGDTSRLPIKSALSVSETVLIGLIAQLQELAQAARDDVRVDVTERLKNDFAALSQSGRLDLETFVRRAHRSLDFLVCSKMRPLRLSLSGMKFPSAFIGNSR